MANGHFGLAADVAFFFFGRLGLAVLVACAFVVPRVHTLILKVYHQHRFGCWFSFNIGLTLYYTRIHLCARSDFARQDRLWCSCPSLGWWNARLFCPLIALLCEKSFWSIYVMYIFKRHCVWDRDYICMGWIGLVWPIELCVYVDHVLVYVQFGTRIWTILTVRSFGHCI